ncbi:MAG: hypothetical protein JSU03_02965 [Bacteroidetes bacterium]|nr:hypothetical protein [Bacteroidota bacterium]
MKTKYLLFLIAIIFCFNQCKKDHSPTPDNPYGLPNATQTGAGVFACRINGRNFIAGKQPYYLNGAQLQGSDTIAISGQPSNGKYFEFISLTIKGNLNEGATYSIDSIKTIAALATDSTCLGISSNVITSFSKVGIVILTRFDKSNKIVSGTFNCAFPIPNCDTLTITDGRFDYHYQ